VYIAAMLCTSDVFCRTGTTAAGTLGPFAAASAFGLRPREAVAKKEGDCMRATIEGSRSISTILSMSDAFIGVQDGAAREIDRERAAIYYLLAVQEDKKKLERLRKKRSGAAFKKCRVYYYLL
jgi:hypothetical protein